MGGNRPGEGCSFQPGRPLSEEAILSAGFPEDFKSRRVQPTVPVDRGIRRNRTSQPRHNACYDFIHPDNRPATCGLLPRNWALSRATDTCSNWPKWRCIDNTGIMGAAGDVGANHYSPLRLTAAANPLQPRVRHLLHPAVSWKPSAWTSLTFRAALSRPGAGTHGNRGAQSFLERDSHGHGRLCAAP